MTRNSIWQEFNRRMGRTITEGAGDIEREAEQQIAVAWFHDMMDHEAEERSSREQTAAAILASLIDPSHAISEHMSDGERRRVVLAVRLTDALRAERAKGGG